MTSKPKICLIINPVSGRKKGMSILKYVALRIKKEGFDAEIHRTEYDGHATKISRELNFDEYCAICVIGGDGSMHEVINGIMTRKDTKKLPIGLIPAGTGNSLAHDLECLDLEKAVDNILSGEIRKMDLFEIKMSDRILYAFNVLGWGIPVDINLRAERMRWLGFSRYNLASLIEILRNKVRPARIVIKGKEIKAEVGFLLALNTMFTGNGMRMAPSALIDDGLIDLLIVKRVSRFRLFRLFLKVFKGTHITDPCIDYYKVKSFQILEPIEKRINIDGQNVGRTPINVRLIPQAIEVFSNV